MHTGNELVASVFQLKKGLKLPAAPLKRDLHFAPTSCRESSKQVDSGWIEIVGWDFPEAAYVASFANSK
jgi:hypothetical protein